MLHPKTKTAGVTAKKPTNRPAPKYADLGFGDGELVARFAKARGKPRIIEGVEKIESKRIEPISEVNLRYAGFEKWLKKAKNSSYRAINASLFFDNFKCSAEERGNYFKELYKKLKPGGYLRITDPVLFTWELEQAGFELVVKGRHLKKSEAATRFEKKWIEYYTRPLYLIIARKPRMQISKPRPENQRA